jgi:hypothetical protein
MLLANLSFGSMRPPRLRDRTVRPLLLVTALVTACGPSRGDVRQDLERYLSLAKEWAPTEAETARTVQRILATQFVDEDEVRRQIAADRPRVAAHLATIKAMTPATDPVRAIHADYVAAWQELSDGYADILRGLDATDASLLSRGRTAIDGWRTTILETAQRLRLLASGAGVDLRR